MKTIHKIKFMSISLFICSCSIAPIKPIEITKYLINYNLIHQNCISSGKKSIYIKSTTAISPYNTHNMLYSKSPYTINQYSYSVWANLPQSTVQQAIINEIQNTCEFANVYSGEMTSSTDYVLDSQIVSIKENTGKDNTSAELAIEVQLINKKNNWIKNKLFIKKTTIVPSPQNFAIGISNDLNNITREIASWVMLQNH